MFNPIQDACWELTPEEFERYSLDVLSEQTKNLENLVIEHDKIVNAVDGSYQIDGYIEFSLMGVTYKTLVECKHYKSPINREKVQILHSKIQSIGAHKGILIATSNFQSGAVEYATKHGIALIQLTEAMRNYQTRSMFGTIVASGRKPFNFGNPYSGVLIGGNGSGSFTCSYLSRNNTALESFMKN
ncbi:restriction endonuclease [Listeria seeligeri]|uniref:restriction endonuclease n=1 Tax=Listeria seeligeri TaxID=1640 RepID=UPI001624169C|nr:restriction endonuclease [Listeria seeligeri]MBC1444026.1 restriction endonuclease [Listeria seeligeri]MBC1773732.1 restriction endonuclease [Listeria seeligeri]MBF2384508.1 restriction endonuclease [Listeria seeligeri]MBF2541744.1 restriction endonuclease [Listeria seeligeri]MBF2590237.1 restriction endonuclease [Listeria seeligeri]